MAHIYKRGSKWACSVHNTNYLINGMKHKITISGFPIRREAQLAVNKVENSIDEKTIIKEPAITLKNLLININGWNTIQHRQYRCSYIT